MEDWEVLFKNEALMSDWQEKHLLENEGIKYTICLCKNNSETKEKAKRGVYTEFKNYNEINGGEYRVKLSMKFAKDKKEKLTQLEILSKEYLMKREIRPLTGIFQNTILMAGFSNLEDGVLYVEYLKKVIEEIYIKVGTTDD